MWPPKGSSDKHERAPGEIRVRQMALQGLPVFPCLFSHGEFMGYFYTQILPPWKNKDKIRAIDASKSISLKFLINIKL